MYQIRTRKGTRIEHKNHICECNCGKEKEKINTLGDFLLHNKNCSIIGAIVFGAIGGYALKSAIK